MNEDDDELPISLPKLHRTLSATYIDPFSGESSCIDPNSRTCSPSEKQAREAAILRDLPETGYADGIRAKRLQKQIMYSSSCKEQAFFFKKKPDDENKDEDSFGLPIRAS